MSKPLLGGSAAAAVLLSASLLFLAQPSVAEPLAAESYEVQQKAAATETKTPGADTTQGADAAETDDATRDTDKSNAAGLNPSKAVIDNSEPGAEKEASSPAVAFTATAYSLRGRTASGQAVSRGFIAADRRVLPIGTRVRLEAGFYSGEYVVADTGGSVRGRKIDIWVPSTGEAMRFGRRPIKLTVLTRTRPRTTTARNGR
jgi:3D (Asp-Asp-Asp) domain-containing protein